MVSSESIIDKVLHFMCEFVELFAIVCLRGEYKEAFS